jgi:UMF1 family MFS transporter
MMYDFANSAFTTIIVTVVYSVYFINTVVGGDPGYGEMLWGRAIGISMTLVALTAPILGAVADFSAQEEIPLPQLLSHSDLYCPVVFR